jgi:hypothetical protein
LKAFAAYILAAAAPALLAAGALADEIVFKAEFGGGKVKCEIYREDDDYIRYIDVEKKMDCGCSREIVEKVVKEPGELLDVEEFFLKKAREAKDGKTREAAEKIAEELRRKREAESGKAGDAVKTGERRVGKCLIKPTEEKTGIKKLPTRDTGSNELQVDPFPEEGGGPAPAPAPPADDPGKQPGKRAGKK